MRPQARVITALSKLRWYFVIGRNGEELGVGYVVEGSARKADGQGFITVQLNDVLTGSHVRAERHDCRLAD